MSLEKDSLKKEEDKNGGKGVKKMANMLTRAHIKETKNMEVCISMRRKLMLMDKTICQTGFVPQVHVYDYEDTDYV